jgi:NADH:ubiquinone reductase (H+-translocating)
MNRRTQVVVIGGGFAGLSAVRGLRTAAVDILLIDRSNHHVFQPLLYQVATAGLAAPSIAAPLRHIVRDQRNVTVQMGTVQTIDVATKSIVIDGSTYSYDYLIVASGVTHAYFGHEEWRPFAPGLKTLEDAMAMRARILLAFEAAEACGVPAEREAWLTFVIVGGGPTGVELAGTLAEIARHTLKREFRRIDPATSRVILMEAGPRVLPAMTPSLSDSARHQLESLGVSVRTASAITDISAAGVRIGEEFIAVRTVLWAAGVAASPLGRVLGASLDKAGRVIVNPDLTIPGHPDVFIAGDLASVSTATGVVPGIAPAAKQMGRHVAQSLMSRLCGAETKPFHYRHYGLLATVGRMAAVADLGRIKLAGLFAWWFWLLAHIYFLIGFRNRLVVLIDWASAYWTYRRNARIIIRQL